MRKWITMSYSWRYMIIIALAHIAICLSIGWAIGWFWHHEWVKPCKKASERPGEVSNAQEKAFKSEWEREGLWDLKNELCKLTGTEKPVKIYQGKWSKDFLEVMKCTEEKSKN